jgi:methionyl aminopeptidase
MTIKNDKELQIMRESGLILRHILQELGQLVEPGRNLLDLDKQAEKLARKNNAVCTFKGYRGFRGNICLSVNDEVVHGIPKDRILNEGDIVSIDIGITYRGYITDSAITVGVGTITPKTAKFLETNQHTLQEVIKIIHAGTTVGDIGAFIQERTEKAGYSIVRELTGHGVGRSLHENPFIPNYGKKHSGEMLPSGVTLAIEPIIAMGKGDIQTDDDGWTIRTSDGSFSCHFEHTIIVHDTFAEIIT